MTMEKKVNVPKGKTQINEGQVKGNQEKPAPSIDKTAILKPPPATKK